MFYEFKSKGIKGCEISATQLAVVATHVFVFAVYTLQILVYVTHITVNYDRSHRGTPQKFNYILQNLLSDPTASCPCLER